MPRMTLLLLSDASTACSYGKAAKSLRSGCGLRGRQLRLAQKTQNRICSPLERRMDTGSWLHQAMRAALGAGLGRADRFRPVHPSGREGWQT